MQKRPLTIHYSSEFQRAYKKLPEAVQNMVDRKDRLFRVDPMHPGLHTHKLHGPLAGLWSFYINRDYRVLFEFIKNGALFHDVGTHDIYK